MSGTVNAINPLTARSFLNTLGIDTHISYTDGGYANISNVIADLKYLGVTQVRDGVSNGANGSAPISSYIALAQAGIQFTFIVDASTTAALNATLALIDQVEQAVPGSVIAVEGPNEINNQPLTYNGISGLPGAVTEQADLYSAVHSDSNLKNIPIYYFTGYGAGGIAEGPDPSVTPGLADYDNQHPYPNAGQAPAAYVSRSAALDNEASRAGPAVFTETGYTTDLVNADVQAKYELDLLMDTAQEGISKTFLYELMDAYAPGSPQGDAGYGLFDYRTAPKEVATALHNLTELLQDSGANALSFAPTAFGYSLSGLPSTGDALAIQKSDGTNILAVWNEPQIWNSSTATEVSVSTTQITVNLGNTYATVDVYDPLTGTAPIATYANAGSLTIGVSDHPIFIQFSQNAPTSLPSSGSDTLVLNVSEIAQSGKDAQFTVSVDGVQLGGTQTATASQSAGASQNIAFTGSFGSGPHKVSIAYLDGFTGNAGDYGRTLYLNAITFDDATIFPDGQFAYNTVSNYTVQAPSPAVASNVGATDTLVLNLSQTAASGQNAQFMVSVDGQIVGGLQTVTASHAAAQSQNVTLTGNFGSGAHTVTINFVNGFAGAPADVGRLLYVNAITLDGATITENAYQTYVGTQNYSVTAGTSTTPAPPVGNAPTVSISTQVLASDTGASATDGITNNGMVTLTGKLAAAAGSTVIIFNAVTALGAAVVSGGNWTYTTTLGAGAYALYAVVTDPSGNTAKTAVEPTITVETTPPTVAITTPAETLTAAATTAAVTLTGTVGGPSGTSVQVLDGMTTLGAATLSGGIWSYAATLAIGTHSLTAVATDLAGNKTTSAADVIGVIAPTSLPSSGSDTLVLNVSEIAQSGKDAQFTVSVDGVQLGGTQTATASQSAGASQNIAFTGSFGSGPHKVSIAYLDGFTGNAGDYGRTLYLNAITFDDATTFPDGQFAYNTVSNYTVQAPSPAVASNVGATDTLVLNLSQTAASGQNAQFMVSVDGQIVGGLQTVTASHAAAQSQNVTLTGNFGSGAHTVTINFVNGFAGAPADVGRLLYVNAITLDGATITENAYQTYVGTQNYSVTAGTSTTPAPPVGNAPTVSISTQVLASDTGASATDGITNNGMVTLTGKLAAAAGSTVIIFNAVTALGAAVVSGGNWTYTTTLGAGAYALYAVVTDPSGNTAKTAVEPTITVETTPPTVAITTPAETLTAAATTAAVTLTGTVGGPSGTSVQVLDGMTTLGAATLSGGIWSYAATLAIGTHSLTAVATDLAGNKTTSAADVIGVIAPTSLPSSGSDTLVLNVSEIAQSGKDAQFTVSVDGVQLGGTQTATASQSAGASQNIAFTGSFGSGPHKVSIAYLDGFTGNAGDYGRTLYLNAITFDDATTFPDGQFAYNTVSNYTVQAPSPAVASNVGATDTLVLNLSQTAASGQNAQFMVSVDGQIVGGLQTVTASHAAAQSQNVTLTGNFGSGAHTVTINFVNGFAGAPADVGRLLYVNAITLDGATITENAYQTYVGTQNYSVTAGTSAQTKAVQLTSLIGSPRATANVTYNAGDGAIEINESSAAGAVLKMGAGLSQANVALSAGSPGTLIVTDGLPGDTIAIDNMLGGGGGGVAQMQFIDGTVWTSSQMLFDASSGSTGADTIVGTPGNDVIDGRGGGDMVSGNGGDDTYIFRQGYGSLQITNATAPGVGPSGQLDFGTTLTGENLWFSQDGNNLDVSVLDTRDQIVIKGWFGANPTASLSEFVGGDGLKLDNGLNLLVSNMATYQINNPTFDPATAAAIPSDSALQKAIAMAWHV